MSGNPFRRAQPKGSAAYGTLDDRVPPSTNATAKKKKVTIQTPPQSPEEVPRKLSAGRISPPPPTPSAGDDEDSDSTATADSDLDHAVENTRRNSGSLPPPSALGVSATGAPYNPFARTLATSEAAFGLQQTKDDQKATERDNGEQLPHPSAGRPALDVDAFKNMLMTGSAAPSPPVSTSSQGIPGGSSSTDTSSNSRQSLFDPYLDVHDETPRTSFDQMDSPSASGDDEEGSSLMSSASRLDDFAPPAPPKHSHGKPLAPQGPQTVSFADFEKSIPSTSSRAHTPLANATNDGTRKLPTIRRQPSDLNKPLPPPPQQSIDAERRMPALTEASLQTTQHPVPTVTTAEESIQAKKAPPPPPTSRRGMQTAASQRRTRRPSNPTQDSIHEEETSSSSKPAVTTPKAGSAPPPPPSRKARPTSQMCTPSTETPSAVPSPVPNTTEVKAMPPPPPRRNPSKQGSKPPALNRSPSSASHSSISRKDLSPAPNQNAPPAPPPRRGMNSKRDSMDGPPNSMASVLNSEGRRGSSTSVDSGRWTASSNLQQVTEPAETVGITKPLTDPATSNDTLSDLSAFQAEIDALRAKAEGRG